MASGMMIHGVDVSSSKQPLDSLHQGHISKPMAALGGQEVGSPKKSSAMGMRNPKGMGRNPAKAAMSKEKAELAEKE